MIDVSDFTKNHMNKFKRNKHKIIHNKRYIKEFFNDLKRSFDKIKLLSFSYELYEIKDREIILHDEHYFPLNIKHDIKTHLNYIYKVYLYLNGREISIYLTTNNINNKKYEKYIYIMLMWLDILSKYAPKECVNSIDIYIYLSNIKRKLPENEIISSKHVNGGYSYAGCNKKTQITVFRQEEWFKVFIHETMHAFDLAFSNEYKNYLQKMLYFKFPLKIDFYLFECYCECWALLWNTLFHTFIKEKENFKHFFNKFIHYYNLECQFTDNQCKKLLLVNNLDYNNLHINNYKEDTPVFSYFFLKRILLLNIDDFLEHCDRFNDESILKFKIDKLSFDNFLNIFLKDHYFDEDIILKDSNSRMTLIDFE